MQKVNKVIINDTNTGKKHVWYMGGRLRDRIGRYAVEKTEKGFSLVQRIEMWCWAMAKKWLFYPFILASLLAIGICVTGGYGFNAYANAQIPKIHIIEKEVPVREISPILKRVAKCESGLKQFRADGRVLRGKVEPSDIGILQLNETIWNDKARELGFDIYTEDGNWKMGQWIFDNFGSSPWSASSKCWR
jgi:hypothetical protein